jgi:Tripartite tricarboxylate transporter TctB family
MKKLVSANAVSGLLFTAFGVLGIILSLEESIGTAARMGPGYMPLLLSSALAVLGAVVLLRGLLGSDAPVRLSGKRPLAMVLLSVAAFAVFVRSLGFGPAVFAAVVVACYAEAGRRLPYVLLLALVVSAFSSVVFVWGLGLAIPVLSSPWKF